MSQLEIPAVPPAAPDEGMPTMPKTDTVGWLAGIGAYTMWGVLPIYLKELEHVSALEFVAHRIVWSFPFLALLLWQRGLWVHLGLALLRGRTLLLLLGTSLLIFVNWLVFVYANFTGQVLQGSLGYFINPLVVVTLACFVFGERLRRLQMISLVFATGGVLVQVIAYGVVPWIALMLAFSFAFYGLLRKITHVGPIEGLAIETMMLTPPALVYLFVIGSQSTIAFMHVDLTTDLLLIAAGPLTVVPLLLFTIAARRLPFATIGFLQYIGPSLQFLCAVFLFGEIFGGARLISFILIWTALVLFSIDALRRR